MRDALERYAEWNYPDEIVDSIDASDTERFEFLRTVMMREIEQNQERRLNEAFAEDGDDE
jgi:hypothetical protein